MSRLILGASTGRLCLAGGSPGAPSAAASGASGGAAAAGSAASAIARALHWTLRGRIRTPFDTPLIPFRLYFFKFFRAMAAAAPPRARLVIKEMVLCNFKSYAGEQRIGPFHKARRRRRRGLHARRPRAADARRAPQSFSSVVGPNGSGKSNVIDALLFVFGKRAKQVRLAATRET
jgi:hypothetical protein